MQPERVQNRSQVLGPDAMSLEGCNHTKSQYIMYQSTAQLRIATQSDALKLMAGVLLQG